MTTGLTVKIYNRGGYERGRGGFGEGVVSSSGATPLQDGDPDLVQEGEEKAHSTQ